jgi:hypothetical protein
VHRVALLSKVFNSSVRIRLLLRHKKDTQELSRVLKLSKVHKLGIQFI